MVTKLKIAISGKARSGKNTLAEQILEILGQDCKIFAFADPMKEIVMTMFPASNPEHLWGPSEFRSMLMPGTESSYRDLLLELGALGRRYCQNTWINATIAMVDKYLSDHNNVLISDVRFKNELRAIKESGFYTIRIVRPGNPYSLDDISEKDLDDVPDTDFDFVLINDGSLEELSNKTRDLLRSIRKT